MDLLRQWVEEKYKLPLSHEAFSEWTMLDMLTAFWEDHYHRHPTEAKRVDGGKEVKFSTGDPLLDKWEEEISRGLEPDLTEGLSPEARAKEFAARERSLARGAAAQEANEAIGDGFADSYGA